MALWMKGAPVAAALTEENKRESDALRARGVTPTLALVRLGEREDDLAYGRSILLRCEKSGVQARTLALPSDAPRERLEETVRAAAADPLLHGILLFRPLPFGDAAACAAIPPEKDVDGVCAASMASLYASGGACFAPCTAEACMALLRHYDIPLAGRRAVVVGRSLVIGKPLAMLLLRENATVTVAHSHTEDLPAVCREADIVIAACGKEGLIGAEHLRPGQTVIDVGIHVSAGGSLCGDVRFAEAEAVAAAVTPVPGGVGPVTAAILCRHVLRAAEGRN